MPQVRRSLINDEGRYCQIQRKPDALYFRQDRHDELTGQSRGVFRRLKSLWAGMRVRCTSFNRPKRGNLILYWSVAKFPDKTCATGVALGETYIGW
jgi:hypothetical protein